MNAYQHGDGYFKPEIAAGPYEHQDRCQGAEGECMWRGRCTQKDSTCRCCCPVCAGDTPDVWGYDGDY